MKIKRTIITFATVLLLCTALIFLLSACGSTDEPDEWDSLGGGGTGEVQDSADTAATDNLSGGGAEILGEITDIQQNTEFDEETVTTVEDVKPTIETAGDYKLSGTITGQINVMAEGVTLYFDNCHISHTKKVITSDAGYDIIIVLMDGTENTVTNSTADANAISNTGNVTINGSGKLTVTSTKSGIKSDSKFYGLGGELVINAGTGHGISADSCILKGISVTVNSAEKDGIHAETEDTVMEADPVFRSTRGYTYVGAGTNLTVSGIYGDGIQADTYVLIDGGSLNLSSLPTWTKAVSSDSCYSKSGTTYSKVAAENSTNYSNLYQLSQSCKGIKVGEIDYTLAADSTASYTILENTAYSLIVTGGQITISTTDDGLHTNSGNILISGGVMNIQTSDDGVGADKNVKITGGSVTVSKSYEGIEGETIDITGGTVKVTATDDGINASSDATTAIQKTTCYIKIGGGVIYVSSGGDGIDSNGGVQISGGELYVSGPTSGADASLDSETGIIVTGGTLIALGTSGMVETPATNSTKYCVSINLSSAASGAVTVKSGSTTLAYFSPSEIFGVSKNYQSIVISHPDFTNGSTYSVVSGSATTSVTISGIITKVGNSAGPGTGGKK